MEQADMEPVIIEDLVKFGADRGLKRGEKEGGCALIARRCAARSCCESAAGALR
jgi:hypothetical protein